MPPGPPLRGPKTSGRPKNIRTVQKHQDGPNTSGLPKNIRAAQKNTWLRKNTLAAKKGQIVENKAIYYFETLARL